MKFSKISLILLFVFGISAQGLIGQTITNLIRNGSNGEKRNLIIIGDGFTNADQNIFNTYVNDLIMRDMFGQDLFDETLDAYNVFRINVDSDDSGVTQVDADGNVTVDRNTALDYRYSGIWDRCWMESGPNTNTSLNNILTNLAPFWDYVFVVLNETGFGGCAGGPRLAVTRGVGWAVCAHEMGHMVGGLADEYFDCSRPFTGNSEPSQVNVTRNSNPNTIKWKEFIDPNTNIFTNDCCSSGLPSGLDADEDVGLFHGGKYVANLYRPVHNCRMRGNSPLFCPVCYQKMLEELKPYREYDFDNAYTGDFNGDGRDDIMIHFDNSISLYESVGQELEHYYTATERIAVGGSSWQFQSNDQFFVGDFDNDGLDDLFVFNGNQWSRPYFALLRSTGTEFQCVRRYDGSFNSWQMQSDDQFFVGDFSGDGRDDVFVVNTTSWSVRYLAMLRSNGNSLTNVRRYDNNLGNPSIWQMRQNDQFCVGDFNGDGREDLYVSNNVDWGPNYVGMIQSNGNSLNSIRIFANNLPGWTMDDNDQYMCGDVNGDGLDDLYVFNGVDWATEYLLMVRSTGNNLAYVRRFDNTLPGWDMENNDQYYVGDMNGDGRDDLYIYNPTNWSTEYLGMARSTGSNLTANWQANWIGSWNLGRNDRLLIGNFNGGGGWDDVFIRNRNWFGMLRSNSSSLSQTFICPEFIHNFNYHQYGWW